MNKFVIILIGVVFIFSGCVTQKRCSIKFPTKIVDSTVIEYRDRIIEIRDTVNIFIKGDSISHKIQSDTSYLETKRSSSFARYDSTGLFHTLVDKPINFDTIVKFVEVVKDTTIYKYRTEIDVQIVERELTQWQILQMWGGRILALLVLLLAGLKILKKSIL